jgi:hypothetical protein
LSSRTGNSDARKTETKILLNLTQVFYPGNTKGGSITVPLTSCLIVFDKSVSQIKTKIVSSHTADPSQTGGQWYGDTFPFSIPWFYQMAKFLTLVASHQHVSQLQKV